MSKKIAFVFPGQGSQSVGMLADLASQFAEIKQTFDQASEALGYDLWTLSQQGPAEELDKTMHTQPALLTGSCAIWRIIQNRKPIQPAMLAGHSLGEYSALVCANAVAFTDAVKLVAARGQYMQDAVAPGAGAMAAIIGLDEITVASVCKTVVTNPNEVLSIANYNSIGQIVIAGNKAPVERAMLLAKQQGAKMAIVLPVSVPSHCNLMRPAAERLAKQLVSIQFKHPEFPILNNVDVAFYTNAESIREGLISQLFMPVRWVEVIQKFVENQITHIVECGAGKILTGLNKRIDKSLQCVTTFDTASLNAFLLENNDQQKTG